MGVLMALTMLAPWTWPSMHHVMSTRASLVRGTFNWVWLVAAVCSLGLIAVSWKSATTNGSRVNLILWASGVSFGSAYVLRSTLRWDRVEKADRRQMTLFIESAYPIERTNKWGMTRTDGYRIRTA